MRLIIFLLLFFIYFNTSFASLKIKEVFPNTKNDANLEYFYIENISLKKVSLIDFYLKDKSGKIFYFQNYNLDIGEGKFFFRPNTKIILNNSDEEIFLYNKNGDLIDEFLYFETQKGKVLEKIGEKIIFKDVDYSIYPEKQESEKINYNDFYINLEFQNPSYVYEKDRDFSKDHNDIYINCDKSYEECKINFDFRSSFSSIFKESDFYCESDFGFKSGQENKCNPSTILFPIGDHEIKIKIASKNSEFFLEKTIFLKNSKSAPVKNHAKIYIPKVNIKLQSGAKVKESFLKKRYICNKKICKINLIYEDISSDSIECNWNFSGSLNFLSQKYKCNPYYIGFGPGIHKIKLRVCDKYNSGNCNSNYIFLENIYKKQKFISNVKLQGILSKKKFMVGNKIFCVKDSNGKCALNFFGEDNIGNGVKFEWDFGNGETFFGKNPKTVYFEVGKYFLSLKTSFENLESQEKIIEINILDTALEKDEFKKLILSSSYLNIEKQKIIINDFFLKNLEFFANYKIYKNKIFEIKKDFSFSIRKNKDYVSVHGKHKAFRKIFFERNYYIDSTLKKEIFPIKTKENGGFLFKIYNDRVGEFIIKAFFIDKNLGRVYFDGVKKYTIGNDYTASKKIKNYFSKKEKKETQKKNLIKKMINYKTPKVKISIGGKIGKNKKISRKTLICYQTCSVNFDSKESQGDIKSYFWDFGNGQIFYGSNPGYIKYKDFGEYKVILKIEDNFGNEFFDEFMIKFKDLSFKKTIKKKNLKTKREKQYKNNSGTQLNKEKQKEKNHEKSYYISRKSNFLEKIFMAILFLTAFIFTFILLRKNKIL